MSYKLTKQDQKVSFRFEVPAEDFAHELEREFFRNKDKMNLSVYRDGKVPPEVMEKMYDKNEIITKVMNTVIAKAYNEAIDENDIEVVSAPVLKVEKLIKGEPFVFTAEAILKPVVTLGNYTGIEVPAPDFSIEEESVEKSINNLLRKFSKTIEITDRPVEEGDLVYLDFEGFLYGRTFKGNKAENFPLTIGSNSFVGNFEEQLIGAKINIAEDITVTYPEDYRVEELAGNDVIFRCIIRRITMKSIPELNDEFVKEHTKFETVDAYRDNVRKSLQIRKKVIELRKKEDIVVQTIVKNSEMDIPPVMIDNEQQRLVKEQLEQIKQKGLSQERYFKMMNVTLEKFTEQMRPLAEKRVTGRLVLESVAKAENLTATPDDITAQIEKLAQASKMSVEDFKASISRSGERRLKNDIAIQKAARFVVENSVEI